MTALPATTRTSVDTGPTSKSEACQRFADILLATHCTLPRSPDDPVQRCACGRALVGCEVNSAARDAGLLTEVTPAGQGGAQ